MSDSSDTPQVPTPEPNDSAEVVRCLEAAREMWELAQLREAVRWVQRGAEAAEQDGNDLRALKLARLGADLAAHANALAEKEAEANSVDVTIDTDEPAEASAAAPSSAPEESAPNEPAPASAPAPIAAPSELAEKAPSVTPVPGAVEKVVPRVSEKPAAVRSFPAPSRPPANAERASVRPAVTTTSSRPKATSVTPKATAAAASSSAANGVELSNNPALAELIAAGKAERVSVKRSALDPNVLVVRSSQGNGAGPRTRQAVLVYVDEDAG